MKQKYFVLTGRLNTMKREEAIRFIQDHGGIVQSMVTEKTDYLIVGSFQVNLFNQQHVSRKRKMAAKLIEAGCEIHIINEEQLLSWMNDIGTA